MTADDIEQATVEIVSAYNAEAGVLLPVLHALQEHFGYVPSESVPTLAKTLNLSRAEVHGVISFYDWFRLEPGANTAVYICRAEACQARGGAAVERAAKAHLNIDYHQSRDDIFLQPVYCLGNCACGPSVMVNETLYSGVSADGITRILDTLVEKKS